MPDGGRRLEKSKAVSLAYSALILPQYRTVQMYLHLASSMVCGLQMSSRFQRVRNVSQMPDKNCMTLEWALTDLPKGAHS